MNPNDIKDSFLGFRIVRKQYSQVRAIFAELGHPQATLDKALKEGHGIEIDHENEDPTLCFVVSEQQMDALKRHGVDSPTFLQMLGTSEVIARTEEEAIRKFREMKGDPRA